MSSMIRTLARQLNTSSRINMAKRYMQTNASGGSPSPNKLTAGDKYVITGIIGGTIGFGCATEWYKNDINSKKHFSSSSPCIIEYGLMSLFGVSCGFLYPATGVIWLGYQYVTYGYDATKTKTNSDRDSERD
jgi:hypothetical protein